MLCRSQDESYVFQLTEKKNERTKNPQSLRTEYQVVNHTRIRKNQKVVKNENNKIELKPYPTTKKKETIEKPKIDREYPQWRKCTCLEFERRYYCQICECIIKKQKKPDRYQKIFVQNNFFLRDYVMQTKR